MDEPIFAFLNKKIRLFRKMECRIVDILFLGFITLLSVVIRYSLRNTISMDFTICLDPWMDAVRELGGAASIGSSIGNYTPMYMYLFALFSYLPIENLGAIKLITLVFDYAAAAAAFYIIYHGTQSFRRATVAYSCLLFLPSVLLNGAVWAQCDIIYTMFLLISLERILSGHPVWGSIAFGIAFSFKLQAIFFFPVLIILWIKRKVKIKHLLLIPLTYLISIVPAVLAGRDFKECLMVYFGQFGTYNSSLTFNMPNIYQLVGDIYLDDFGNAAIFFTIALLAVLFYYLYHKKFTVTFQFALTLSVFVVLLVPYFLPYMHERYAFAADLFALILFCVNRKYYWAVISTQLISLLAYQAFLFGNTTIDYSTAALFYLAVLIFLAKDLKKQLETNAVLNEQDLPEPKRNTLKS